MAKGTKTCSIVFTERDLKKIDSYLQAGKYSTKSEVIRASLRKLK